MRHFIGASVFGILLFATSAVGAEQTPGAVTIRTIVDENRSGAYESDTDTFFSEDSFIWLDVDGDMSFDQPHAGSVGEQYWNVEKTSNGMAIVTSANFLLGAMVCGSVDFGLRIPESYEPYKVVERKVCRTIRAEATTVLDLLAQRWSASVLVWSWVDSNANGYRDYGERPQGLQEFDPWVDGDSDGELTNETVITGETSDALDSGRGATTVEITGLENGDIVCIAPGRPPEGYHVSSLVAAVPSGLQNCHALTSSGITWQGYGNPVWPGRPSAMFIFGEAEGSVPIALPQTGGPPSP